jgi:hypothetical protein
MKVRKLTVFLRPMGTVFEFERVIGAINGCRYKVSHLGRDEAASRVGHPDWFMD